ncbi:MAG: ABC transporter ATP-binding protein [Proteobacteria bacterium]|nr:MAG: ABC transporter ATP-binding protein [Pseudomonadota bacterium]
MKDLIRFTNVSKDFTYYAEKSRSLKTALVQLLKGNLGKSRKHRISVLQNVSFKIARGEFVAIMGRNGAGKSTTLKLISGIYEPTVGKIAIEGTIAPLIELGAGFDMELSGYENIFLNASIIGFSRRETQSAISSIIEFSELGDLIHMPLKNYSSGMLVRLGFSVATHINAETLLVDEVLAVGDVGFQQKCINKIKELYAAGRTIVLVTHSPDQVLQFAKRVIVLDAGTVLFDGNTKDGVAHYLGQVSSAPTT